MALVEPIIVVLGPWCGGTSAVAGVLHHLGVFMGTDFDLVIREPHDTWEDYQLALLCRKAFAAYQGPGNRLRMDPDSWRAKLRGWADTHRRAALRAEQRPGAKHPLLCLAVDAVRDAWGPVVPVVVDRPQDKVVASLNRLGWLRDEQERADSTAHLVAARDRALGDPKTIRPEPIGAAAIRVDFEALRAAPGAVIRRLARDLRLEVTEEQVAAATRSIVGPVEVRAGDKTADPAAHLRDRLLARVDDCPQDARAVFFLAQTFFARNDFDNATQWYARRVEMGGWDEERYFAMWQIAQSMAQQGAPGPDVVDAYLRAWEFRPTRAEPLYAVARRYRAEQRYRMGYLFAQRAAEIPCPEDDLLLMDPDIYGWRALYEQAVCASRLADDTEAFTLWRRLLARDDLSEEDRQRFAANRDVFAPAMAEAALSYPDGPVRGLIGGSSEPDVVVSLVAGPDRTVAEHTLNSFLRCCLDRSRIGRFLVIDAGLSARDRRILEERYGFLEFGDPDSANGRFWLHLGQGWRFFAPENLITRLTAVLETEPQVCQVGVNFADAVTLTGTCAAEAATRRNPAAGRYVLTDVMARGPAMFDTARLDGAAGPGDVAQGPGADGSRTASLDEVLCVRIV